MKVKPKDYAIALYDLTSSISKDKVDEILKKFLKLIFKNGDVKLIPEVINQYRNYYNKQNGLIDIEVVTAYDLSKGQKEALEKNISEVLKESIQAKYLIDKLVIGGFKVSTINQQIDATVSGKLQKLKNAIV